jgi:hypothetical protein
MRSISFTAFILLSAVFISAQPPLPAQSLAQKLTAQDSSDARSRNWMNAPRLFIAKDRFDKVKSFYQHLVKKGDSVSTGKNPFMYFSRGPKDSIHVLQVEISQKYDSAGFVQSFAVVNSMRKPGSKLIWTQYPGVFQYLGQQVGKFGHTEADFNKLVNKYLWVYYAYYKEVNAKGTAEDTVIYQKHYKNVYGESTEESAAKTSTKPMTEEEAQKMNDKMRDLASAGDMNAIMQMNMQMAQQDGSIDAAKHGGELAEKGENNDNWNEWAKCLEEFNAAAYGTLIKIWEWNECNPKVQNCPHEGD